MVRVRSRRGVRNGGDGGGGGGGGGGGAGEEVPETRSVWARSRADFATPLRRPTLRALALTARSHSTMAPKRKAKADNADGAPAPKMSAYQAYVKSELARVKELNPSLGHDAAFRMVAAGWKQHPSNPTRAPTETTSKFWGVSWDKNGRRWMATYTEATGKKRWIGLFDTQEAAAHAVNAAIRRAGLEGKRHTNPVVDGQLVPRARKTPKKRRREEPAATS